MKQILITLICILSALPLLGQTKKGNPMSELWNDPQFQKEFTASYGTLAGYEPPISEEEKSTLRTLIKVIKSKPKQAIKQLSEQMKADDSAAFDFILANLYFHEGDLENAEKFYNQAIKKSNLAYSNLDRFNYKNTLLKLERSINEVI